MENKQMIWIPQHELELRNKWLEESREEFIEQVRNADWGFIALCEMIAETEGQDNTQEKQLAKDVARAFKIIKERDGKQDLENGIIP